MRGVANDMMSMLIAGCEWRRLLEDLPPRTTIDGYFGVWAGKQIWRRSITLST
jgi:transposase